MASINLLSINEFINFNFDHCRYLGTMDKKSIQRKGMSKKHSHVSTNNVTCVFCKGGYYITCKKFFAFDKNNRLIELKKQKDMYQLFVRTYQF